ncbi:MAG TPA: glycosyltransferase [Candidatus Sulfotelmatobacter sp.]|nr:glycosyltransferase [Candidatus Sulfotelmatobacter sp.]
MGTGTISIAMCTFNGAAWVGQQLRSLLQQQRRPDELVICDDASTDQTWAIVREFADRAPFPVTLKQNPERLGVASNFSQAIGMCSGELIAPCDQDDWWGPRKLLVLGEALERDPALGLVFSDANLVDEDLRPLGVRLWDTLYLERPQRERLTNGHAVPVLARTNVVTGATMMFRAELRPLILPISPLWLHDAWMALLISAVRPCGMVDEPLVDYRQHPRQQIGARRTNILDQVRIGLEMDTQYFAADAQRWGEIYERLRAHGTAMRYPRDLAVLAEKARFTRDRYQMRLDPAGRWEAIARHWASGNYQSLGWGWKSLLQDVVIQA